MESSGNNACFAALQTSSPESRGVGGGGVVKKEGFELRQRGCRCKYVGRLCVICKVQCESRYFTASVCPYGTALSGYI